MKVRIISAIIGASGLITIIALSNFLPILINIIIAIASIACVIELLSANKMIKNFKMSVPSMLFAVTLPLIITSFWKPLILLYVMSLFIMLLKYNKSITFNDIAFNFTTTSLISFGMSSIVLLCNTNAKLSIYYIVLALAVPWFADGGAYFVGSFLGKRKLCPKISPKKTVEGAIGGVLFGIITPIIVTLIFQTFYFDFSVKMNYIPMLVIGLIATVFSIVGDLSFSLIKRSCHVKDYGALIPGHGGVLDRFDSVIFSTPVIYIFINYFPILILEGV